MYVRYPVRRSVYRRSPRGVASVAVPLFLVPSGLGDYSAVADAITKQEGITAASPYYSLNNPGMLVFAGQSGATPVTINGVQWASWPSFDQGYQALLNQIGLDASRGETISQFTAKYAPAGQGSNNPTVYAQNIAAAVGLSPDDLLSSASGSDASVYTLPSLSDASSLDFSSIDLTDPAVLVGVGLVAALLLYGVLA